MSPPPLCLSLMGELTLLSRSCEKGGGVQSVKRGFSVREGLMCQEGGSTCQEGIRSVRGVFDVLRGFDVSREC